MKNLYKKSRLALHPTCLILLALLSAAGRSIPLNPSTCKEERPFQVAYEIKAPSAHGQGGASLS